MTSCGYEVLDRAIAGRMPGVLTAEPKDRRQWSVRFLAYDAEHDGIWLEPVDERQPLDDVIASASQVQVAIGIDHSRFAFSTRIDRRDAHFWLNDTTMMEAVLASGPIELFVADRRAHPRYLVPDSSNTFAQLTLGYAISPVKVKPWDVSAGGISFLCPRNAALLKLKANDNVGFSLNYRGRTIAGKANVRFTRLLSDRVFKIGAQFNKASLNETSEANLTEYLADMARLARPPRTR